MKDALNIIITGLWCMGEKMVTIRYRLVGGSLPFRVPQSEWVFWQTDNDFPMRVTMAVRDSCYLSSCDGLLSSAGTSGGPTEWLCRQLHRTFRHHRPV